MLKDVLQFSKHRETLLQNLALDDILNQVITLLNPVLKKQKIRLINQVSGEQVKGDPGEIKTLFHHLIENSIEAIQENGEIEFLTVLDLKRKMHRVFIRDTGCGIKSSRRIFEPFYTTKESGTGLGLSIVQQIIENHNGTIALIFSEPGNTIFQISLPLA
jgi:two-component system sensor histidine kinase AtoS